MINHGCVMESCMSNGAVDYRREMRSGVVRRPQSSLSPALRVVLPEDASSASMPPATITTLWQQMVQITSSHSGYSQSLIDLAACLGDAFNADGCAIIPDLKDLKDPIVYWFADAPPLHMQPSKTLLALFEDEQMEVTTLSIDCVETVQDHHTAALEARKFLEIWQPIASSQLSSLPVVAILGTTTHAQGRVNGAISLMRSRPHTWAQSEIVGLQTVSHQVASTIEHLRLQQQLSQQMQHQRVVNQLTLAIHNASDLSAILKLATNDTAQTLQVQRAMLLRLKHWDPLFRNHAQTQLPKIRINIACEWLSDVAEQEPFEQCPKTGGDAQTEATSTNQSFWLSECTLCQQAFLHPDRPILLAGEQLKQSGLATPQNDLASSIAATFNIESLPALLLAPLESQGIVLGFLVFQQAQPRLWQPQELS
jgi:GAF domain-containing protein